MYSAEYLDVYLQSIPKICPLYSEKNLQECERRVMFHVYSRMFRLPLEILIKICPKYTILIKTKKGDLNGIVMG